MAKCEKREIKPVAPPVEYVLTLSACEASLLRSLLGRFQRGPQSAIWEAIADTGVDLVEVEISRPRPHEGWKLTVNG